MMTILKGCWVKEVRSQKSEVNPPLAPPPPNPPLTPPLLGGEVGDLSFAPKTRSP
ncbi:MAG: hypothetical protein F6K48_01490 [Okeania sp. SIO3H1]|uniref:hypothetical protein n=1 Tax=Okeania sp. SIO1I7 TaxID=2607772 RepID=UPI0013C7DB11|nr:hypothetical protein [Okeania sp. SIO1I7]NEN87661.1 hypothetical protein [Okeania sp. SIO3H1]NET25498.1 hypothetical protein [Okeania sp. SIO1I7]